VRHQGCTPLGSQGPRRVFANPNSCEGQPRTTRKGWKMAQIVTTVGIDVSKDRLDVCIGPADEQFSVTNDPAGWRQLVRRLQPLMARAIGLEASGGYERGAIDALLEAGLPVRLVNPWKLRKFAQAFGVLAKNDRLDARVIAQFVASAPSREVHRDRAIDHLAELVNTRRQLVDALQQIGNQAQLLRDAALRRLQARRIRQLERDVVRLDQLIGQAIAADAPLSARRDLLCSMPGVGPVLAATLLALLPELGALPNRSVAGMAPTVSTAAACPKHGRRCNRTPLRARSTELGRGLRARASRLDSSPSEAELATWALGQPGTLSSCPIQNDDRVTRSFPPRCHLDHAGFLRRGLHRSASAQLWLRRPILLAASIHSPSHMRRARSISSNVGTESFLAIRTSKRGALGRRYGKFISSDMQN